MNILKKKANLWFQLISRGLISLAVLMNVVTTPAWACCNCYEDEFQNKKETIFADLRARVEQSIAQQNPAEPGHTTSLAEAELEDLALLKTWISNFIGAIDNTPFSYEWKDSGCERVFRRGSACFTAWASQVVLPVLGCFVFCNEHFRNGACCCISDGYLQLSLSEWVETISLKAKAYFMKESGWRLTMMQETCKSLPRDDKNRTFFMGRLLGCLYHDRWPLVVTPDGFDRQALKKLMTDFQSSVNPEQMIRKFWSRPEVAPLVEESKQAERLENARQQERRRLEEERLWANASPEDLQRRLLMAQIRAAEAQAASAAAQTKTKPSGSDANPLDWNAMMKANGFR